MSSAEGFARQRPAGDSVDHVLLTRFNLPTKGMEGAVRAREGWLQERTVLFERYCAPSVGRQVDLAAWLVYFDPQSPPWLIERLTPLIDRGLFRPVFRESVSEDELLADIRAHVVRASDYLLTTNLDNDDGLGRSFTQRLQSTAVAADRAVLYVTRGLIKRGDELYLRVDRRNAFCSVRSAWADPVTAWSEYHNEFPRIMPAVELAGPPGWLQVVHGGNVSNRVRGRLVSPDPYGVEFGEALDDVRWPSRAEITRDRLLGVPTRSARDVARTAVRVAGLRLLGKDRYQHAKLTLSGLRRRGGDGEQQDRAT